MRSCLLINPNTSIGTIRPLYDWHENLGLALVCGLLRKQGHQVALLDLRVSKLSPAEVAELVHKSGIDLIGISVNYATIDQAALLAKEIKRFSPAAQIFLGGEHATYLDEMILQTYSSIDGIVRGEGEQTFMDLAEQKTPLEMTPGLSLRGEHPAQIHRTVNRTPLSDLGALSWAARDVANLAVQKGIPVEIGIIAQRGCPFTCSFCNASRFLSNDSPERVRYRHAESVVDEIVQLRPFFEEGSRLLRFYDATFVTKAVASRKWAADFCQQMEKRSVVVPFDVFIRADSFDYTNPEDQALLKRLKAVGMVSTYMGIEAGDETTLKLYHKGVHVSNSQYSFLELFQLGMSGSTNGVIAFHQSVTINRFKKTLELLRHLGICSLQNIASRAQMLPGIELERQMVVNKRESPSDVYNYDFTNQDVARLYRRILDAFQGSSLAAFEDHLIRRLIDIAKARSVLRPSKESSDQLASVQASARQASDLTYLFIEALAKCYDDHARAKDAENNFKRGLSELLEGLFIANEALMPRGEATAMKNTFLQ